MVTICNQSGTIDLSTYSNAETRHELIACETDNGGYDNSPEMLNRLGMQETVNRLIPCDNRAE